MEHAFLITAYRDPAALIELLDGLPASSTAYIHYDRRSHLSGLERMALERHPCVRLLSRRFRVRWGGRNHLLAMLELCRAAVEAGKADRLHLISGSDRIVVPERQFLDHFTEHPDAEFLLHFSLPTRYWKDGGLDRLELYHPLDLLDQRSAGQKRLTDLILRFQQVIGLRRSLPSDINLRGGGSWWSLTRACVAEVLAMTKENSGLLERSRWTHVPEEIYFPTMVMSSSRAPFVVNNDLRYMLWSKRDGQNPAILDERDLRAILDSGMLFARKLDHPWSTSLMRKIELSRRT